MPQYAAGRAIRRSREAHRVAHGLVLLLLAAVLQVYASAAAPSDSPVKAAFLYRFASYVQWPAESGDAPFTIGVFQAEEVARELERTLPALRIRNQTPRVRRVTGTADLDDVHVLYIGEGRVDNAGRLLRSAARQPILVVTDQPDGLRHGGIINFTREGDSVRLEVSLPAAERAGLRVDSGLLAIAARVEGKP